MGGKEIVVMMLMILLGDDVMKRSLSQNPGVARGYLNGKEKSLLVLGSLFLIPGFLTVFIVLFSRIS
jgi:hypothetical protein